MGKVPSENTNMTNAPCKKFPVVNEYNCIDCVNPHGRKKVDAPISAVDI